MNKKKLCRLIGCTLDTLNSYKYLSSKESELTPSRFWEYEIHNDKILKPSEGITITLIKDLPDE